MVSQGARLLVPAVALLAQSADLERALARGYENQHKLVSSEPVETYLRTIAGRLAPHLPKVEAPYEIRLVLDSTAATVFPGSRIYLPAKFLTESDGEPDFAAKLAISMAHVALRHGANPPVFLNPHDRPQYAEEAARVARQALLAAGLAPMPADTPFDRAKAEVAGIRLDQPPTLRRRYEPVRPPFGLNPHVFAGGVILDAYVSEIGQRLAAKMAVGFSRIPFRGFEFRVVVSAKGGPTREPMAMPEGTIYVPAALLRTAEDESEFAGMLAHSMAHVALRHGQPGIWLWTNTDELGLFGALPDKIPLEIEADQLAATAMWEAGFDASGLRRYLSRMAPIRYAGMPDRSDRLASLDVVLQGNSVVGRIVDSGRFIEAKEEAQRQDPLRLSRRPTLTR